MLLVLSYLALACRLLCTVLEIFLLVAIRRDP